jgi:hypothetical protein
MPNRMLTIEEVLTEWQAAFKRLSIQLTEKELRALCYDLQSSLGKFPVNTEERKRFTETVKYS